MCTMHTHSWNIYIYIYQNTKSKCFLEYLLTLCFLIENNSSYDTEEVRRNDHQCNTDTCMDSTDTHTHGPYACIITGSQPGVTLGKVLNPRVTLGKILCGYSLEYNI